MEKELSEDLRQWFSPTHPKGGWKRINTKGEAIGPCAREPGEPKPKCMSNAKRASLTKSERASAVRTKRKHDPNPDRKGKPIMVSNYGKGRISEQYTIDPKDGLIESIEILLEKNKPTSPDKWQDCLAQSRAKFDVTPSAYSNGWAAQCYKRKGGKWKSVDEQKASFSDFLDRSSILQTIAEGKVKKANKKKLSAWKDERFLKDLERRAVTKDGKVVKIAKPVKESVDKDSMPCNKPRPSTRPGKKRMVKACKGGEERIVHYGAKGYGHNYSPEARKNFRARHNCAGAKDIFSAQKWSCKDLWAGKGGSTKSCPEGRKCKY